MISPCHDGGEHFVVPPRDDGARIKPVIATTAGGSNLLNYAEKLDSGQ
ncbi:hypothetical protein JMN32_18975 [Fulvivirga sp. 29W222]|uniref:Uncharacterized protein n=1 Tax=Fulvivirga marina TaxID=2494733 RepID=A0A937FYC2_9BACT|nr:hypothetical protein [Fulvivirga marina]